MDHHAYYIEGSLSLFDAYKERFAPFVAEYVERFGIEEARELIERSQLKNFGAATFFIATGSLTSEAQQALLKLFEEPQLGTTFILLVPHGTLIPTLRSRMLPYPEVLKAESTSDAKKFLQSSQKDRSAYITKFLKNDENLHQRVQDLLNGLEQNLYSNSQSTLNLHFRQGLEDIAKVRSYTNDRSPSLKILLEHLAISLPTLP